MIWPYGLFIIFGYVSGSLMFSWLIPKLVKGIDICEKSVDHNPGTSNAMKYAGIPVGTVCLMCDVGKGFFPVFNASQLLGQSHFLFALVLLAPVAGHAFTMFHRGRGGKAIATTFGVFLGMLPLWIPLALLAGWYVLFSLAIVIHPNERRTVAAFTALTLSMLLMYLLGLVPATVAAGTAGIACIVIGKNREKNVRKKATKGGTAVC